MKVVILAGGEGTRLREIIKDIPKPMAPIANKPFLEYLILQAVKWHISDIVLSVGYKKETIKTYFTTGDTWGVKILYSEEVEPLGTGGAIKKAAKLIDDEDFIVMNGDSFLDVDFNQLITFHKSRLSTVSLGLVYVSDTNRYGRVEIDDKGNVIRFSEKGIDVSGLVNGGVYVFNRKIIDKIPDGKVSLEKEILPKLINQGLYGIETKGFFIDIGVPKDYLNLYKDPQILFNAIAI